MPKPTIGEMLGVLGDVAYTRGLLSLQDMQEGKAELLATMDAEPIVAELAQFMIDYAYASGRIDGTNETLGVFRRANSDPDGHDLYTDADKDRPDAICDGNGSVCLSLCKRCGKAEGELEPGVACVPKASAGKTVPVAISQSMGDGEKFFRAKWIGEPLPVHTLLTEYKGE